MKRTACKISMEETLQKECVTSQRCHQKAFSTTTVAAKAKAVTVAVLRCWACNSEMATAKVTACKTPVWGILRVVHV